MAALAYPRPDGAFLHGRKGPVAGSSNDRRHLELIWSKPRSVRLSRSTYWRRRVAAVLLVLLVGAGVWSVISAGVSWLSANPSEAVQAAVPAASDGWVVGPGDTLWGIARSVQPTGDIRPLVSKMSAERNGAALQLGETIPLPR